MLLFNLIRLTKQRVSLMLLASLLAGGVGFALAQSATATHSSTAIIFASPLFRAGRTDGELSNLVDDLILATELQTVTDSVQSDTGLEIDVDYTIKTDRVLGGGETIELVATASSAEDAETVARSTSQAALAFIVNQDISQSQASQDAVAAATEEILVRLGELEDEAGGVSPVILHTSASTDLAGIMLTRTVAAAPNADETQARARVAAAQVLRREYEQLETQLEGFRKAEVDNQGVGFESTAILASLDSEVVLKNSVENSVLPLIIQGVLVAVLATLGLALALFAFLDRRAIATQVQVGERTTSGARSTTSDAAFSYDSSAPRSTNAPQTRAAAKPATPRSTAAATKTSAPATKPTQPSQPVAARAPGKDPVNAKAKAAEAKPSSKATVKASQPNKGAAKPARKSRPASNGSATTKPPSNSGPAKQANSGPVKQSTPAQRSKKKADSKSPSPRSR